MMTYRTIPHGLVARIQRSHRWGPGSIPGGGVHFLFSFIPNLYSFISTHHLMYFNQIFLILKNS